MVLYSGLRHLQRPWRACNVKEFFTSLPPTILLALVTLLAAVVPSSLKIDLGGYSKSGAFITPLQHCNLHQNGLR